MSDPYKDIEAKEAGEPAPEVKYWQKEIDLAQKRERKFRKAACDLVRLYEADKEDANTFNILYANTETLLPAVYNQLPRPMVERRFEDDDPIGKAAANTLERTLAYVIDCPDQSYEPYDNLFRQAALGAFVPGRGVTWFKYDPKIEGASDSVDDSKAEEGDEGLEGEQTVSGELLPAASKGKVTWEMICGEDIDYDRFLIGYAKTWKRVPWVAIEHQMSEEDADENFGEDIAEKLEYLAPSKDGQSKWKVEDDELSNRGSTPTCTVYEIWYKQERKVVFYAPSYKDALCKTIDDPYGLTGFYPCPEPLRFFHKLSTLTPTALYSMYKTQAKELNRISTRINRVVNALKVRGFYDSTLQGLKELLSAEDNTLLPVKNVASMQQGQNLLNSIQFMPLDMLVKVLAELYKAQEACKQTIYEITGIADIMRGSTQASETATAQNIKNKWGTLRLQNMQGAMQAYIRDCLRIVAELASEHFSLETFAAMTMLPYATPQELAQAQKLTQAVNSAMMQLPPPPPAQPGQPPAPPPAPPPQVQQAIQQIQQIQSKIPWQAVCDLLKSDIQRGYHVDIETNSTLANTSTEDQENITKALGTIAQVMQQFTPAVQAGAMTMPALKQILLATARRFEFGRQVEQSIMAMPDQLPPPPPDPKVNADLEKQKQDIASREQAMQKDQLDMAGREAALAQKQAEVAGQIKAAQDSLALKTKEALSEQKISQSQFLLDMEKRLSQHESKMQAGVATQQKNFDRAALKQQQQVAAAKQAVPPQQDDTVRQLKEQLAEVTKTREAPIKFVRGEDGKPSHVQVGERLRTIKRDAKGKISELH